MVKKQFTDINGKPFNRNAMVAVLLIGTFAGALMQTSLGTAIPTLMRDFDITLATAQQATTWFMLANGIMMPVSAFLSTRIPTKVLYITAYLLLFIGMTIASLTPAQHDMWWMFLAGRIIAAIAVGISMPLMQVVMVNIFPAESRGTAMGLNGIVIGLAPAIGPTLSGWLLQKHGTVMGLNLNGSWRLIFHLPMAVLALVIIAAPFCIKNVIKNERMKLDLPSLVISTVGFGSFLWAFTNVATDGWGNVKTVIAPMIIGALIIVLFVLRQLRLDEPFVDVRVFKNRQFTLTTICVMMSMSAMMGVEMMLPTYLQNVHLLTPLQSGLTLMPGALMIGIMAVLAGRDYDRIGAKRLTITGFTFVAIRTLPFLFLSPTTPTHFITTLYAVRMFGIATALVPLTAMAMAVLPKNEAPHATAANNTARQVASAIVVALLSSVTQNVIAHHEPTKHLETTNPLQYGADYLEASMKGFHVSFAIGLSFAIIGIIVALFLKGGKIVPVAATNGEDAA